MYLNKYVFVKLESCINLESLGHSLGLGIVSSS